VSFVNEAPAPLDDRPSFSGLTNAWTADFETPLGSRTFFSFFLFLGQHWPKETINKVCTLAFQSLRPYSKNMAREQFLTN
jgi:hypothetical protein